MTSYTLSVLDCLLAEAACDIARGENKWNLYKFYKDEIAQLELTEAKTITAMKQLTDKLGM